MSATFGATEPAAPTSHKKNIGQSQKNIKQGHDFDWICPSCQSKLVAVGVEPIYVLTLEEEERDEYEEELEGAVGCETIEVLPIEEYDEELEGAVGWETIEVLPIEEYEEEEDIVIFGGEVVDDEDEVQNEAECSEIVLPPLEVPINVQEISIDDGIPQSEVPPEEIIYKKNKYWARWSSASSGLSWLHL
ncbi:uncharacterized protein [Palaemon carinicauda]|uniref:uncharacterized protein n=1 Tax=Palaemon carinicauda TaxID=392227 RepID=UPI0035B650D5